MDFGIFGEGAEKDYCIETRRYGEMVGERFAHNLLIGMPTRAIQIMNCLHQAKYRWLYSPTWSFLTPTQHKAKMKEIDRQGCAVAYRDAWIVGFIHKCESAR